MSADVDAVIRRTGATYRQLDHWCRRGYLKPGRRDYGWGTGSGVPRVWPEPEIQVAVTMARLVRAGLTPAAAEKVARGEFDLAPGVRVEVTVYA